MAIFHDNLCFESTLKVQWALSLSRFQFVITFRLKCWQKKPNALSCHLYFMLKEGNATYEQQRDVILKHEHLQLQALLVIFDDITFLCQIHEDLKNDLFVVNIQG